MVSTMIYNEEALILVSLISMYIIAKNETYFRRYLVSIRKVKIENRIKLPQNLPDRINDLTLQKIYLKIVDKMEIEKLYLKEELTIQDLATDLKTNCKYISLSIQKFHGTNFRKFLNHYRIEYAKKIITEETDTISIKELPFRTGYSNITTFYRQFKENTSLTPKQFLTLTQKKQVSTEKKLSRLPTITNN